MAGAAVAEDLQIAAALVRGLAERLGPRLLRAALFGSRARGMAGPDSDYDVFLLVDREDREARTAIYDVAYDLFPLEFNFHVYTPDSFERATRLGSPVLRDVAREGVGLWPETAASKPTG